MSWEGITIAGIRFLQPVFIITGCESRGDNRSKYLTRYRLIERAERPGKPGFGLYLHIFHRSDHDVFHDHPWPFTTFILWRGYDEETPGPGDSGDIGIVTKRQRVRPLTVNYRPATWQHRVKLHQDAKGRELPAVTLVWRGAKIRRWGFWKRGKFTDYKTYFTDNGC